MTTPRILAAGSLLLASAGCTPIIHTLDVTDADGARPPEHAEPIRVQSEITVRSGGAGTPVASIKPVYPADASYQQLGTLPDKSPLGDERYLYSGDLPGLDYGAYDLRLRVDYSAWLTRQSVSRTTRFSVAPPAACFAFDVPGPLGFTLSPVRKHDGTDFGTARLAWRPQNWPVDRDNDGSITFQIIDDQFPDNTQEPLYWIVDFMSQNLADRPGWADADGVTFRAASEASGIYLQPLVLIRDPDDGQIHYWAPWDEASGKFWLYPVGDPATPELEWNVMTWATELPAGTREGLYLRVYGDASRTGDNHEKTVYLDGVCPMPPGIDPPNGPVAEPVLNPWE